MKTIRSLVFFSISLLVASSCVEHDLDPPETSCALSDLSIVVLNSVDATSCDSSDGSIHVTATGGKPPYSFQLGATISNDGIFTGLASGAYSVTVIDEVGCQQRVSNIIISATGFSFDAAITEDTDCTGGNGTIALTVNEGIPPFLFSFMDGDFTETSVFESLDEGTYQMVIRDAEGCSAPLEISVPRGVTGTSWENTIRPMMSTYCARSGCHNGVSRPDLRIYERAYFYADQIKELTQDGSMPFEGSLTQAQIDLIACWVDEGALEN